MCLPEFYLEPACSNELNTQKMSGKKALIVISNGKSSRENGFLDRTQEQLRMAGVEYAVFDKVQANPLSDKKVNGLKGLKEIVSRRFVPQKRNGYKDEKNTSGSSCMYDAFLTYGLRT